MVKLLDIAKIVYFLLITNFWAHFYFLLLSL